MEYVDEDWPNQLLSSLLRRSKLNWSITYDDDSPYTKIPWKSKYSLEWRGDKYFKREMHWEISCELGYFDLIFSFEESKGAKEASKGVRPVLILRTTLTSPPVLFKTLLGKGHKKVDGKKLDPNNAWSKIYAPNYRLKPHINDIVDKILEVINGSKILNSVYSVDGVPMLGQEIVDTHNQGAVYALYEASTHGDIALIDNRIIVELLGTPKKASIVRVASKALRKRGLK